MEKSLLRKKYLSQRMSLSDEEYDIFNRKLLDLLFKSVDFSTIRHLHIFLPISKYREVDTWRIIDRLQEDFPEIKIVIPKVAGDQLIHYRYENQKQLVKDKWGIPEPVYGEIILPQQLDVVLVPLIATDQQGHRVGYGKGFYDRFLLQCRHEVLKIGLSLLPLIEEHIAIDKTDVRLDMCVTPHDVTSFL